MRTITDAAKIVGLSRRMIQEYEKAGVALKPTEKNKYGYLIYDDTTIDRLWQIRFYKELGYSKQEIKEVFNNPEYDYEEALSTQLELLKKKKRDLENLIAIANFMKETGLTPQALHSQEYLLGGPNFNDMIGVIGAISRRLSEKKEENSDEWGASEEQENEIIEKFCTIALLYTEGEAFDSEAVQNAIQNLHKVVSPWLSKLAVIFQGAFLFIAPGSELGEIVEQEWEMPGVTQFISDAVAKYLENSLKKDGDKIFVETIQEIVALGKRKYKSSSHEVQALAERIYKIMDTDGHSLLYDTKGLMEDLIKMYSDPGYYAYFDKITRGKGAGNYVSAALRYYCNHSVINKQSNSDVGYGSVN